MRCSGRAALQDLPDLVKSLMKQSGHTAFGPWLLVRLKLSGAEVVAALFGLQCRHSSSPTCLCRPHWKAPPTSRGQSLPWKVSYGLQDMSCSYCSRRRARCMSRRSLADLFGPGKNPVLALVAHHLNASASACKQSMQPVSEGKVLAASFAVTCMCCIST